MGDTVWLLEVPREDPVWSVSTAPTDHSIVNVRASRDARRLAVSTRVRNEPWLIDASEKSCQVQVQVWAPGGDRMIFAACLPRHDGLEDLREPLSWYPQLALSRDGRHLLAATAHHLYLWSER